MIARLKDDRGVGLLEVSISAALISIVLVAVTGFLTSAQRSVIATELRSIANDEVRGAMEQLDREVRSSDFILALDDYTLLVHSQTNKPTSGLRCIQWKVVDGTLQRRTWPSDDPANATGWGYVSEHIVNAQLSKPAFVLPDTDANRVTTGGRFVEVHVLVNPQLSNNPNGTVAIHQTLAGRNVRAPAPAPSATWPPVSPPAPCEVIPA